SVTNICQKLTGNSVITKDFLNDLNTMMMDKREVEHICFEGLREDRESVLSGGVVILYSIFDSHGIYEMRLSNGAVREGML
ncbi:Ppx/GppA family phosphatase, partial [Francisella tularensis subsp. holarctica]|nr:Ppx/GppA family phosphatase [Francisella tularensis subsp. holarctica]